MKRTFTNFSIEASFELPITVDNFFEHSITIRDKEDLVIGVIRKGELSYNLVNDFAIGDENVVKNAIIRVVRNREMWIAELRTILLTKSIPKEDLSLPIKEPLEDTYGEP